MQRGRCKSSRCIRGMQVVIPIRQFDMTTTVSARRLLALTALLSLAIFNAYAATEAVTKDGRHVILDDNGTWKLQTEKSNELVDISLAHATPKSATSIARSGFGVFLFAYDPNKWSVEQHPLSETVEFMFRHNNGSAIVKVVTERVQMTLSGLKELNIGLMQKTDPKAHIENETMLTVNGNAGLVLDNVGEAFGAKWHIRRFLWSGTQGSVQIICTEANNLYEESAADINDLIAGFSVVEPAKKL